MIPVSDKISNNKNNQAPDTDSLIPAFDTEDTLQVEKVYRAGESIMRQGEPGDCAYFIQSGRVLINLTRADGSVLQMGNRGHGSLIGEMAIVDVGPRSATVHAVEDCRLLEISKQDFTRALRNSNPIVGLVTRLILLCYRDILQRSKNIRDFDALTTMLEQQEQVHAEESKVLGLVRMAQQLASLKCHVAQSYFYARPMPEAALIAMRGKAGHA